MGLMLRDDDPTHALDDFATRMRWVDPASGAPDLSDIVAKLHTERPSAIAGPRGGTLRSGQTWCADDVVDVTATALHRTKPDHRFRAADAPRAVWLPASEPRLLARWQPGAWIGAEREAFGSTTELITTPRGPVVETRPPHRLLLLWPPSTADAPATGRWPQQVRLSVVPAAQAGAALLCSLPAAAPLWLAPDVHDIDWALAAEIVLRHDPALQPFQLAGLRAFIDAERETRRSRLDGDYVQPIADGPVFSRAPKGMRARG